MKRITGASAAVQHFRDLRQGGAVIPTQAPKGGRSLYGDIPPIETAARVIAEVRKDGDRALVRISQALDGVPLRFIEVPLGHVRRSVQILPSAARIALETAAQRVRQFQEMALPKSWRDPSGQLGETVTPVERVGIYIPGGTAPLASSVIMTVVPARVAGVRDVFIATPAPGDTLPHPAVLAAAHIAGADRVFKIGGAQAVAAFAYGTETVPKVDLICGPGNIYTTAAKKLVYGDVGVDGLYGPTETLVVADETADPDYCAADLLAQAEHDVMAVPVLIATSEEVADAVEAAMSKRLPSMSRHSTARAAVDNNGVTVIVGSVDEAIDVANAFAPEHLCLAVADAAAHAAKVRFAGGVFVGEMSAEVMADYVAGPSHVMPTGGTARFASALSVRNFVRITPFLHLDRQLFMQTAPVAAQLARLEGLGGHADAAEARLKRLVGE
jgi:histidinol dehydrogenase